MLPTTRLFLPLLVCTAAGCATVGTYQTECEQRHSQFAEMVVCLKGAVAEHQAISSVAVAGYRTMSSDARVKLYILKAEQLSQEVQRGRLTEAEARIALQELYVRLGQGKQLYLTVNPIPGARD